MKALRGVAVSPGYANGTALIYRPPQLEAVERRPIPADEVEAEFKRFTVALERAVDEVTVVREQVSADVGESEAAIFDAHLAMLRDPAIVEHIRKRVSKEHVCAEAAVADEMKTFAHRLTTSGNDYMRELALDVRDVGNRILRHLRLDDAQNPLSDLPPDTVILAKDLMPSDTVCLDRKNVSGIATERGGSTSHASILARSLGIPAVTGLNGMLETTSSGTTVLLNGSKGLFVHDPSDRQKQRFARLHREFEESQSLMRKLEDRVCRLKNGTHIKLLANINQAGDVVLADEHNLDGIGLYRTELMYLGASSAPTHMDQCRHYSRAAEAYDDQPVTIRTFDFAVDKHPSFLSVDAAASLELRGLRFALKQMRLFKSQIRAIVRSANECPNIRILFPMVTGWWELKEALEIVKDLSEEEGLKHAVPVGAMIETPAAVFALPEIVKMVDFISIGCNDLAQYILAMERNMASQSIGESTLHPSLLRAIKQIVETAAAADCPVSICGEAASDPLLAAVFVGLGIRKLSVSPARAPMVRYALRHLTLAQAKRAADHAIHAHPAMVQRELLEIMPPDFQPILAMEKGA